MRWTITTLNKELREERVIRYRQQQLSWNLYLRHAIVNSILVLSTLNGWAHFCKKKTFNSIKNGGKVAYQKYLPSITITKQNALQSAASFTRRCLTLKRKGRYGHTIQAFDTALNLDCGYMYIRTFTTNGCYIWPGEMNKQTDVHSSFYISRN